MGGLWEFHLDCHERAIIKASSGSCLTCGSSMWGELHCGLVHPNQFSLNTSILEVWEISLQCLQSRTPNSTRNFLNIISPDQPNPQDEDPIILMKVLFM